MVKVADRVVGDDGIDVRQNGSDVGVHAEGLLVLPMLAPADCEGLW